MVISWCFVVLYLGYRHFWRAIPHWYIPYLTYFTLKDRPRNPSLEEPCVLLCAPVHRHTSTHHSLLYELLTTQSNTQNYISHKQMCLNRESNPGPSDIGNLDSMPMTLPMSHSGWTDIYRKFDFFTSKSAISQKLGELGKWR